MDPDPFVSLGPVHLTLPGRSTSQNEKHLLEQAALGVLPPMPRRLQGTSTKRLLWPVAGRPTQQVVRLTHVETNVRSPRVRFHRTRTNRFTAGRGSRYDEDRGSQDPLSAGGDPGAQVAPSSPRPRAGGDWVPAQDRQVESTPFCSAQASGGWTRPLNWEDGLPYAVH